MYCPLPVVAGVKGGQAILKAWDFIKQLLPNATWDFLRNWGWPVIAPLTATIWGLIESTPGPVLIQTVLTIFAIGLFIQQNWQQKSRREKPTPIDTDQKSTRDGPTAEQTIEFILGLRGKGLERTKIPIKIVSTKEGQSLARILVDAFRLADYEILINDGNADYLFPATTTHNKIIIRYQEVDNLKPSDRGDHSLTDLIIIGALHRFIGIDAHQQFPSSSTINYFQIEVRGGL